MTAEMRRQALRLTRDEFAAKLSSLIVTANLGADIERQGRQRFQGTPMASSPILSRKKIRHRAPQLDATGTVSISLHHLYES